MSELDDYIKHVAKNAPNGMDPRDVRKAVTQHFCGRGTQPLSFLRGMDIITGFHARDGKVYFVITKNGATNILGPRE
ncbi:MAG TPA: hypothetical protein VGL56_04490 [Fimbriimonadaceae bacterium]|jgi:hypothetical protein